PHPGCNRVDYGHVSSDGNSSDEENSGGSCTTQESGGQKPLLDPAVLKVEAVDFKVSHNAVKHHTDQFDICESNTPQLVVRRGQEFSIQIDFSRAYDAKTDDLRLIFEIGTRPLASKGTQVEFILSDKDEEGQWGAKVAQQSGKSLTLTVFTPPDCIVGKWRFKVGVVKRSDTQTAVYRYNHRDPIYMLFNPWCKGDTVYMERDQDRQAFVLKENGKLFSGTWYRCTAKPWVFGQFSGQVLDCCMFLLDWSGMSHSARADPVTVVRKLTAMVNVQDEGGVLYGNWSGDYKGGKPPLSWTGSAPILEQFYRDKTPVKYGQCWVFSGVLTTVCRALGIPARSITNFESAHDADNTVTVDYHFDADGTAMDDDDDSVWNFHVWNEVWMARPDLPAGYGGWQACDATPQETSDGVYCCGPCPVAAIKEGEVTLPYDGPFIFAEVNADKVYWNQQDDGSWKKGRVGKREIGLMISTMNTDTGDREDVTRRYKFPDDSPEERAAVEKAMRKVTKDEGASEPKDVNFELTFEENTFVGSTFQMTLKMTNAGAKRELTVQGLCAVRTMFYTGVVGEEVARQKIDNVKVKPGESKTVTVKVEPDSYLGQLKDCCMLSLSAMARVWETQQVFTRKDSIRLRKPHLAIKAPPSGKTGQEVEVEVAFTNVLNRPLTGCYLEVEAPGMTAAKAYPQKEVPAKGKFVTTLKLKPGKKGQKEIVAVFNCQELEDINGSHAINIGA
ncbi:hemocyte protein-glutamine gamma-glutamyltransferase-like, partial [Babylonia areolata]|uniref:hemocyte protein-glutamine gamma-glutamyltransferase-like n=1 Tax=Babylonia areolata TaxID=304850 RepID=UPI003FD36F94